MSTVARKHIPEALPIQLTAELLSVSELTVRRMIKRGHLRAHRVGPKLIRVPRTEISRIRAVRLAAYNEGRTLKYPSV